MDGPHALASEFSQLLEGNSANILKQHSGEDECFQPRRTHKKIQGVLHFPEIHFKLPHNGQSPSQDGEINVLRGTYELGHPPAMGVAIQLGFHLVRRQSPKWGLERGRECIGVKGEYVSEDFGGKAPDRRIDWFSHGGASVGWRGRLESVRPLIMLHVQPPSHGGGEAGGKHFGRGDRIAI
ncbi:hypothetical protein B0H19DRAFT_1077663 [Mycena capillaripes]|nr:hypothetical protein B0H19DRAFT_1077663 [Mycena capillaripes]